MSELLRACLDGSLREITNYVSCGCCICPKLACRRRVHRKPRRLRIKVPKCWRIDKSVRQHVDQIAKPDARRLLGTLERYWRVLDAERLQRMCRLIHELQHPQPRPVNLWKMSTKRKPRRHRRRDAKCRKRKFCEKWLDGQIERSVCLINDYLGSLRTFQPNYKQVQVSQMLFKTLNFRKVRCANPCVKVELRNLCQKLAVIIDTRLEPYKKGLMVETISKSTLEDKHCVFKMFRMPEMEEEIEEEEISIMSSRLGLPSIGYEEMEAEEMIEKSIQEELLSLVKEETEGEQEVEESLVDLEPELSEAEAEGEGEEGEEEDLGEVEEGELGPIEEVEGYDEGEEEEFMAGKILFEGSIEEEGLSVEEESIYEPTVAEIVTGVGEEGPALAFEEEEVSVMEAVSEEEAELYHPEGTSSYVDWCLYVSWLKELGTNIEMYANCLQLFRRALASDNASKYQAALQSMLKNWTNYLSDSRKVDSNMTQYFKDKPMTWCASCRSCTIDDYPTTHYIPPALEEAISTTKQWRRLLADAEEYCRDLDMEAHAEESESEEEEAYDILDVPCSSSSSFEVERVDDHDPSSRGAGRRI